MSKLLRKLSVLFMALSLMFFVGCSDSDNGDSNQDTGGDYSSLPIIGTWEMDFEHGGHDMVIRITFNANGTATERQFAYIGGQLIEVQGSPMQLRWTGTQTTFTITTDNSFFSGVNNLPYYIDDYDGEIWLVVLGQFELVRIQ